MIIEIFVNERPILFNGEMVRAILDGRKTQTRRVIKPQPKSKIVYNGNGDWIFPGPKHIKCPFGYKGDELWVRETSYCDDFTYNDFNLARTGVVSKISDDSIIEQWKEAMYYKADGEPHFEEGGNCPWKPSIHMPRWASRIQLKVKGIQVERVGHISEADAKAEGIWFDGDYFRSVAHPIKGIEKSWPTAKMAFEKLWDSINEERGFGWDVNPYVWVVEFELKSVNSQIATPVT